MRILQIAPLWETVPPPAYGGTEAVVHLLTEELVRMGHQVTLYASGDSRTTARLEWCYPRSLRTAQDIEDKHAYSLQHAALALRDAHKYDIVHNHAGHEVMALSHLVPGVPMLSTMHCLITPDTHFIWDRYQGHYNTISAAQERSLPPSRSARFAGVVHNGIDVNSFPFTNRKGKHLLFLSRISPDKGPDVAIEASRRAGRRLVVAGKVDPADRQYFETRIAPLLEQDHVTFVGEADATFKRKLYSEAAALLMPLAWEEPFGLVMAEAQACGTPVIAFRRGAAPEVVHHEHTGFVVDTIDEMVAAVSRVSEIDPAACRRHVRLNFDGRVMAMNYLRLYASIIGGREAQQVPVPVRRVDQPAQGPAARVA